MKYNIIILFLKYSDYCVKYNKQQFYAYFYVQYFPTMLHL